MRTFVIRRNAFPTGTRFVRHRRITVRRVVSVTVGVAFVIDVTALRADVYLIGVRFENTLYDVTYIVVIFHSVAVVIIFHGVNVSRALLVVNLDEFGVSVDNSAGIDVFVTYRVSRAASGREREITF